MVKFVTKFTKVASHRGTNNYAERRDCFRDKNSGDHGDQANIQSMMTLVVNVDILRKVTAANTGPLLYYNKGKHGSAPKQNKQKRT